MNVIVARVIRSDVLTGAKAAETEMSYAEQQVSEGHINEFLK
jgi:hypothetical protein